MRIEIDTHEIGDVKGFEIEAGIARELADELAYMAVRINESVALESDQTDADGSERRYLQRLSWFVADTADRLRAVIGEEWTVPSVPIPERFLEGRS